MERRVACEEVLHIYFHAGLDPDSLPSSVVEEIVAKLEDQEGLAELLDSLDAREVAAAVVRLPDYRGTFTMKSARAAVPVLANRLDKLSNDYVAPLSIPLRALGRIVILYLLESIGDSDICEQVTSDILEEIPGLSGRLFVIEIVGYRENVGRGLVSEEKAQALEEEFSKAVKLATASDLASECELSRICYLPEVWPRSESVVDLRPKLIENLHDDSFLLGLLRTAIANAFLDGEKERVLPWELLLDVFGDALPDAVNRVCSSDLTSDLSEEDLESLNLARDYALGNGPQGFGSG